MNQDRLKGAIEGVVRNSLPFLDYQALYFGRVAKFDTKRQQVDVETDDPRMPTMQGVPLRGPAGVAWSIDVTTPTSVLIGWENANPSRPFALAFSSGAHVLSATWLADMITLGGTDGAEPPPRGATYRAAEDAYFAKLNAAIAAIGGALGALGNHSADAAIAALAAAAAAFNAGASSYLATNVKVR